MSGFIILPGDCAASLMTLPGSSVHCCITSPPYYGLRDYGVDGQIGLEPTPEEYIQRLVSVFREVRRVLRDDGTLWVNIGDSYARQGGRESDQPRHWDGRESTPGSMHYTRIATDIGLKPKDLIGIPWMLAFALRADGWWLRQDIIWHKPNPMPESVKDRCTKAHEYIFMLSKSARYWYDAGSISEGSVTAIPGYTGGQYAPPVQVAHSGRRTDKQSGHGRRHAGFNDRWDAAEASGSVPTTRNRRSVWTLATLPTPEAHFATFPIELPELCLKAGCPEGGTVLDPFSGAGTTGLACLKNGRQYIGCELNPKYVEISYERARKYYPLLLGGAA